MKTTEQLINEKVEAFRQELLKEFSEENKPILEIGKWYKLTHGRGKFFGYITDISNIEFRYYGFSYLGLWQENGCYFINDVNLKNQMIPATDKEVEEALIAEAKRRGFKKGVRYSAVNVGYEDQTNILINSNTFKYLPKYNELQINNWVIFKNGKWAEIIEDKIMIGGHEVKKESGVFKDGQMFDYKIGCKRVGFGMLCSLKSFMINNEFKTVAFDGIETDLETIEKILKL